MLYSITQLSLASCFVGCQKEIMFCERHQQRRGLILHHTGDLPPCVSNILHENLEFSKLLCIFANETSNKAYMLDRAQTIEKLQSSRQYLSEHYGVSSMLLFGSVARNEQKEDSDVDV